MGSELKMIKLCSYETYLDSLVQPVIPIERCEQIYMELISNINVNDEVFFELWNNVLEKCFKYMEIRMNWSLYSREKKMDIDSRRTAIHDTLIISFDMLSRYMEKNGKSTEWRKKLGDDRKRIGDFGCYIAYVQALNNR